MTVRYNTSALAHSLRMLARAIETTADNLESPSVGGPVITPEEAARLLNRLSDALRSQGKEYLDQ